MSSPQGERRADSSRLVRRSSSSGGGRLTAKATCARVRFHVQLSSRVGFGDRQPRWRMRIGGDRGKSWIGGLRLRLQSARRLQWIEALHWCSLEAFAAVSYLSRETTEAALL